MRLNDLICRRGRGSGAAANSVSTQFAIPAARARPLSRRIVDRGDPQDAGIRKDDAVDGGVSDGIPATSQRRAEFPGGGSETRNTGRAVPVDVTQNKSTRPCINEKVVHHDSAVACGRIILHDVHKPRPGCGSPGHHLADRPRIRNGKSRSCCSGSGSWRTAMC